MLASFQFLFSAFRPLPSAFQFLISAFSPLTSDFCLLDTLSHLINDLATRRSVAILSESATADESKDLSSLTLMLT
jgi:hypothetical protein